MSTPLAADLSYQDLRVGWQRVADRYSITAHIFRLPDGKWLAVTNRNQGGAGEFVESITPAD